MLPYNPYSMGTPLERFMSRVPTGLATGAALGMQGALLGGAAGGPMGAALGAGVGLGTGFLSMTGSKIPGLIGSMGRRAVGAGQQLGRRLQGMDMQVRRAAGRQVARAQSAAGRLGARARSAATRLETRLEDLIGIDVWSYLNEPMNERGGVFFRGTPQRGPTSVWGKLGWGQGPERHIASGISRATRGIGQSIRRGVSRGAAVVKRGAAALGRGIESRLSDTAGGALFLGMFGPVGMAVGGAAGFVGVHHGVAAAWGAAPGIWGAVGRGLASLPVPTGHSFSYQTPWLGAVRPEFGEIRAIMRKSGKEGAMRRMGGVRTTQVANMVGWAGIGAAVGGVVGGMPGVIVGGVLGGIGGRRIFGGALNAVKKAGIWGVAQAGHFVADLAGKQFDTIAGVAASKPGFLGKTGIGAVVGGALGGVPGAIVGGVLGNSLLSSKILEKGGTAVAPLSRLANLAVKRPGLFAGTVGLLLAAPVLARSAASMIRADRKPPDMTQGDQRSVYGLDANNLNTQNLVQALHYRR